jgi:hypothetical protein
MFQRHVISGVLVGLVSAATMVAFAIPSDAARRKGRVCQSGHFHYGPSAGQRSKKVARAKAIASWAEFTAFEYGNAWARFKRAGSRSVRCSEDATGWGCNVEAVPCRRR